MIETAPVPLTPQEHIKNLEQCVALGDIGGMARSIEELHRGWDGLDAPMQADIRKLEAIFLSLVQMKKGGRA
jgi:hypothetical protein